MQRQRPLCAALVGFILFVASGPAAGQGLPVPGQGATEATAAEPVDTFVVTLESRTAEHPYQNGFRDVFAVDGVQGKELVLEKGKTYLFQMDGIPQIHPFYLTTSPIGFGADPYDEGVEGNGASENDELTFTPPTGAPDSLWYQCVNHSKMGWRMALTEAAASASVNGDGSVSFEGTGVTVDFAGTTGSGEVSVSKFNSAPDGPDGITEANVSDYRFALRAEGDLSFSVDTEVRFDVDSLSGTGDASNVTVYRRDSTGTGSFSSLETTYDADENVLVVSTDAFSEFVFASNSEPLPVELTTFDARTRGNAVELGWRTASETNNAGFEVQRRVDHSHEKRASWTALEFVESKASGGGGPTDYQFEDASVPFEARRLTYRLKQVDTDGSSHFSDPVTVSLGTPTRVALRSPFPNPATRAATIRYELPRTTRVQLGLYNALGQQVATLANRRQSAGRKELQFEVPDLASGRYILRLAAGAQVQTETLTIVR